MKNWWIVALIVALVAFGGGTIVTQTAFPQYILDFAAAVENAEGFQVAGSVPQRKNNPGDIADSSGIKTFPTVQAGLNALYNQIAMMFNNTSAHYNSGMSIMEVGMIYANGDPNWGNNVASYLGVSPDLTLDDFRNSYGLSA